MRLDCRVLLTRTISSHCPLRVAKRFRPFVRLAKNYPTSESSDPSYAKNASPRALTLYPKGFHPVGMPQRNSIQRQGLVLPVQGSPSSPPLRHSSFRMHAGNCGRRLLRLLLLLGVPMLHEPPHYSTGGRDPQEEIGRVSPSWNQEPSEGTTASPRRNKIRTNNALY